MTDPTSEQKPPQQLMEYLFMLPAILALSPLIVAFRHTHGLVSQDIAIYVFRMLSLAWLWMMCALILYYWRPSVRSRFPFVTNVLRATLLGCLAVAPIVLTALAVANKYRIDIVLYSELEKGAAWFVLLICALTNVWFLKISVQHRPVNARGVMWEMLSGTMLMALAAWVLWLL